MTAPVSGYGVCPLCRAINPYGSTRERSPNGYTRCGSCDGRTLSIIWVEPSRRLPYEKPAVTEARQLTDEEAAKFKEGE